MGDSLLTISTSLLVYSDAQRSTDPKLRDIDYKRLYSSVRTGDFESRRITLPADQSETIANQARSVNLLTTSEFSVVDVSTDEVENRYRVVHVPGGGSPDPLFRTRRDLDHDSTSAYDVTLTENLVTLTWNGTGPSPDFAGNGVIVGDQIRIEEYGPFNEANWGTFEIVAVTATTVKFINADAVAETGIVLGAAIDGLYEVIDCFSSDGVQIDDEVMVRSTGFLPNNRGVFTVLGVTPGYFEIENTSPGIEESAIALGATDGFVFYPDVYGWLYVESDREVSIRLNGDTSDRYVIRPVDEENEASGTVSQPGVWVARTTVWSLVVQNNGTDSANVRVMLAR